METPTDAGGGARRPARRGLWIAVAALAAGAAWWSGPDPWPEGPARLLLEVRGAVAVDAPVAVGAEAPVRAEGGAGGVRVSIGIPGGVKPGVTLRGTVRVDGDAGAASPPIADLRATLVLPDGRREMLPLTGGTAVAGELAMERRPPIRASVALALLVFAAILWVSEAVPLFVPALAVPVALVVVGGMPARDALAPYFDPILALFLGGYLMAGALRGVGLDALGARTLVAACGRTPGTLFAGLLVTSAFLSCWMSNTAAAALLLPLAISVSTPLGPGYRRAAILGVAYAATVGGTGTLVGTPANLLAARFLEEFASNHVSYADWLGVGLPFVALLLPVVGIVVWRTQRAVVDPAAFAEARRLALEERARAGRLDGRQATVLVVLALVVGLWVSEPLHGVDPGIVALGASAVLAAAGRIGTADVRRVPWESLLVFGCGIALGLFTVRTGASDWMATRLAGLSGLPPLAVAAAVGGMTLALTALASNTASAVLMIPLMFPLAGVLGVEPAPLVVTVALASSVDFAMVIGTPPTMMAHATGFLSARAIFRAGILLDLAGWGLLVAVLPWIWRVLGVL